MTKILTWSTVLVTDEKPADPTFSEEALKRAKELNYNTYSQWEDGKTYIIWPCPSTTKD